ncbi:CBS domain containing protein [Drepanopeziza brunnea f. sp. 'multigermtubi' MB_m1]|uniref:Protein SDS23 n=1 Tax=Marssonina brunnea f. sp. multigermtubi (strain MB_m1) TaxID=1072389 RepID=K1WUP8_MARBU|nr:CBS domain containing protein [Drepanopeziza brunnea f. sp. 'multigermtubi' MB_m1]EKD12363.1 CBS domain containing protein [Drepanopeziza brunnea f. sp. 'multigermtubi' MB_m1]
MVDPVQPLVERGASPSHSSQTISQRSSFADNLRHSPRSQRRPSFPQSAVQELLNHPPLARAADPRFAGREWRQIRVGELVDKEEVRWARLDTGVEQATKLLIEQGPPNVILLRESPSSVNACGTFDYSDLNAYLLVVVGLANPEGEQVAVFDALAKKAREGVEIPLQEIQGLAKKGPLVTLSESEDLSKAIEHFACGTHRILITKDDSTEVVGILSQLKLVKFLWDNGTSFPAINALYPKILRDLEVGTPQTIAINGDRVLTDALQLMNEEGLTSIAVVDSAFNVVGNISAVDVKLLTNSSSLPLLKSSCIHFISVILSERGIGDGKDSFPVFHVTPFSTLAHTVAKLVATRSHRMWIVEAASPSPGATPLPNPSNSTSPMSSAILSSPAVSGPASPNLSTSFPAVSAAALPSARISGRLTGVISLTDILNLFARQSGLNPLSPNEQRAHRRRSSSSMIKDDGSHVFNGYFASTAISAGWMELWGMIGVADEESRAKMTSRLTTVTITA